MAVNDLQPQGVEEAYFFISRSTRKEVSLTNPDSSVSPNEKAISFFAFEEAQFKPVCSGLGLA